MRQAVFAIWFLLGAVLAFSDESTSSQQPPGPEITRRTVGYGELHEEWRGEVIQLSWEPRTFLLKGFLNDEECDHLISLARPKLRKSTVVDSQSGKSVPSEVRTSKGMFLSYGQDEIVAKIEKRVAQVTMIPISHQEGMQILKYENGEKYEPHFDFFQDQVNQRPEVGGQRIVTVLMYLTTVEEGGETVFPNAKDKVEGPGWSDCAKKGLAVKTQRGDAVMFYGLKPDGSQDKSSLHGSCPTVRGEKWSATKWIHVLPFSKESKKRDGKEDGCVDSDPQCSAWAARGECDRNPSYMKVNCKKACNVCSGSKVQTT